MMPTLMLRLPMYCSSFPIPDTGSHLTEAYLLGSEPFSADTIESRRERWNVESCSDAAVDPAFPGVPIT